MSFLMDPPNNKHKLGFPFRFPLSHKWVPWKKDIRTWAFDCGSCGFQKGSAKVLNIAPVASLSDVAEAYHRQALRPVWGRACRVG